LQPEVGTTAKPRGGGYWREMLVRRERSGDERAIRRVHAAAFRRATAERDSPPEVSLVDNLRASRDWLAKLSLVAMDGGEVIGHVLCTRARLARGSR
jgi:putative acetyltransferase